MSMVPPSNDKSSRMDLGIGQGLQNKGVNINKGIP